MNALQVLYFLKWLNLSSVFSNINAALRTFLTLPISICTGERFFSLLVWLKSPLRSYLLQGKLSQLAVLCFNADITNKMDFYTIIDKFAESKIRKKLLKMHKFGKSIVWVSVPEKDILQQLYIIDILAKTRIIVINHC